MQKQFPFGIDPAGQVPDPSKKVTIVVGYGRLFTFDQPFEPITALVAQVKLMSGGSEAVSYGSAIFTNSVRDTAEEVTITGWDPVNRILTVKLKEGAMPITHLY